MQLEPSDDNSLVGFSSLASSPCTSFDDDEWSPPSKVEAPLSPQLQARALQLVPSKRLTAVTTYSTTNTETNTKSSTKVNTELKKVDKTVPYVLPPPVKSSSLALVPANSREVVFSSSEGETESTGPDQGYASDLISEIDDEDDDLLELDQLNLLSSLPFEVLDVYKSLNHLPSTSSSRIAELDKLLDKIPHFQHHASPHPTSVIRSLSKLPEIGQLGLKVSDKRYLPLVHSMAHTLTLQYWHNQDQQLMPVHPNFMPYVDCLPTDVGRNSKNRMYAFGRKLAEAIRLNLMNTRMAVEADAFAADYTIFKFGRPSTDLEVYEGFHPLKVSRGKFVFTKVPPIYRPQIKMKNKTVPLDPFKWMKASEKTQYLLVIREVARQAVAQARKLDVSQVLDRHLLNATMMKDVVVVFKVPKYPVWYQFNPVYIRATEPEPTPSPPATPEPLSRKRSREDEDDDDDDVRESPKRCVAVGNYHTQKDVDYLLNREIIATSGYSVNNTHRYQPLVHNIKDTDVDALPVLGDQNFAGLLLINGMVRDCSLDSSNYNARMLWHQSKRMEVGTDKFAVDFVVQAPPQLTKHLRVFKGSLPILYVDGNPQFKWSPPNYDGRVSIDGVAIPADPFWDMEPKRAQHYLKIIRMVCRRGILRAQANLKENFKSNVYSNKIFNNTEAMAHVVCVFKLPEYPVWFQFHPVYATRYKGKTSRKLARMKRQAKLAEKDMTQ